MKAQMIPMDWSSLEGIKVPSKEILKLAAKIGIKESYNEEEYNKLNKNNDISKRFNGDIISFVIFCHEINDRILIESSNKKQV